MKNLQQVAGERKKRKPETARFIVKWKSGRIIYFRAFKRRHAARNFQARLQARQCSVTLSIDPAAADVCWTDVVYVPHVEP